MLFIFALAATASFIICLACLILSRKGFGIDTDAHGIRRYHSMGASRLGGIGIFSACVAGLMLAVQRDAMTYPQALWTIVSATPVFVAGVLEDFTHRINARWRLFAALASAGIAAHALQAVLFRLDVYSFDILLRHQYWVAFAISVLAIAGVSHAINLIDGYNGLTGVVTLMMSAALAYVAYKVGNFYVMASAFCLAGSITGFLVWNYPSGILMAGDGGAYFLGFFYAMLSILLVNQSPQVSAWFPLACALYPIWETLFSMYRRLILKRKSVSGADALHFHHLIYRRFSRWAIPNTEHKHAVRRNSMTSPYLWAVAAFSIGPSVLFWDMTWVLQLICVLFAIMYVWAYFWLLRGKHLVRRKSWRII